MIFKETNDFRKDFKRLSRKYRSLNKDIALFEKFLSKFPLGKGRHFAVLTEKEAVKIVKARLFCLHLKRDSLRIIYSFNSKREEIEFVELYFKGNKERENKERITLYLKNR